MLLNMTQGFVFTLLQLVPVKLLQSEKGESVRPIHYISTLRKQCPYMTIAIGNTHSDKPSCGSGLYQTSESALEQNRLKIQILTFNFYFI